MRVLALPLALALSACSLAPAMTKQQPDLPSSYPYLEPSVMQSPSKPGASDLGWRSMFRDPRLQRLIEVALDNNHDLRLAVLNVGIARSQFRIQRASRLPSLEATGSGTRQRTTTSAEPSEVSENYTANVGLSAFEVDLFGRVRSLSDAAMSRYLATEEGRRAAQITLVAAVADAYFAETLAQEQLTLSQQTLDDWRRSAELTSALKSAGQVAALDVEQAQGQVATAEADTQARTRSLAQASAALNLLVGGQPVAGLPLAIPLNLQPVQTKLPPGVPSDLLARRPDIRQAEHSLEAANADIGAARAAFFPRLSITASLGYASPSFNSLFEGGQKTWSFMPQIAVPIFQGGRLRAELRVAELRKEVSIVEYERVVQNAFREVAVGLAGTTTFGHQIAAQQRFLESAEKRAQLSEMRYRAGLDGRLELLDAQRQLYAAKQGLLELRHGELSNAVSLFKALGGGLEEGPLASN